MDKMLGTTGREKFPDYEQSRRSVLDRLIKENNLEFGAELGVQSGYLFSRFQITSIYFALVCKIIYIRAIGVRMNIAHDDEVRLERRSQRVKPGLRGA